MLPLRFAARRAFSTSPTLKNAAIPVAPAKRPVGAFRGGIFGFLLGSTVAGVGSYFYVYEEYKLANDLLTEDIDALRSSIGRMELHLRALEEVVADNAAKEKKGRK
ncbi:hypothetical protein BZA05DRAFT_407112 [Tricharina praecox]|uniref:uncharacterized protein n=1 Tax=Tricharina praecox TaxID=43433 RepID=UPI00221E4906|nr:uncharacterized protein BZA05DRAFT_407112 [Tricharina praecox]KAI5846163.1 hypothetical protein BZA05DRAFT_407112 [Tricharina praecox]